MKTAIKTEMNSTLLETAEKLFKSNIRPLKKPTFWKNTL